MLTQDEDGYERRVLLPHPVELISRRSRHSDALVRCRRTSDMDVKLEYHRWRRDWTVGYGAACSVSASLSRLENPRTWSCLAGHSTDGCLRSAALWDFIAQRTRLRSIDASITAWTHFGTYNAASSLPEKSVRCGLFDSVSRVAECNKQIYLHLPVHFDQKEHFE